MKYENADERQRAAEREELKKEGLPEDLRERPPGEQINIVNERIAEVTSRFLACTAHLTEGSLGPDGEEIQGLLRGLAMERGQIKKKIEEK